MTQPSRDAEAMVTKKLTHSRGHKCAHDLANRDLEESQKQVLKRYEKDFELFFMVNLYFLKSIESWCSIQIKYKKRFKSDIIAVSTPAFDFSP